MSEKNRQSDYYLNQVVAKNAMTNLKEYYAGSVGADLFSNRRGTIENVDLDLLTILLDTTAGGYFTKDIIKGNYSLDVDLESDEETDQLITDKRADDRVKIYFEPLSKDKTKNPTSDVSVKGTLIKQRNATYSEKVKKDKDGKTVTKDGEPVTVSSASPEGKETLPVIVNKNPDGIPDRFKTPSLSAYEFLDTRFSLGNRNNDFINLFFNAITPLEMSRAVPYIQFKLITSDSPGKLNKLSLPFFFRHLKKQDDEIVLDDNAGLSRGSTFQNDATRSIQTRGRQQRSLGMDLFTSPQTAVNMNIRKSDPDVFNEEILDPTQPLLSLKSLKFDNTGMGGTFYTSKSASVEMTLHDRSRLKDIEKLVSARDFGLNQVLIEYGWSHPDGGPESNNDIGKMINSMRDVGLYNVQQSSFSIGASGEINISMTLRCTGLQEFKNISTSAGYYTPLLIFRPQIEQILEEYINSKLEAESEKSLPEVRKKTTIERKNALNRNNMIPFDKFAEVMVTAGYYEGSEAESVDDNKLIELLKSIIDEDDLTANTDIPKQTIVESIMGKTWGMYPQGPYPVELEAVKKADPMLASINRGYNEINVNLKEYSDSVKNQIVSLGKVLLNFIGYSFAGSGRFDEIQMFFYPLNTKSSAARIFSTASFPIDCAILERVVTKKIEDTPNISTATFVNLLNKEILSDESYWAYGLSDHSKNIEDIKKQVEEKVKKKKEEYKRKIKGKSDDKIKELKDQYNAEIKALLDEQKKDLDREEKSMETKLINYYRSDGGPTVKPVFQKPNIKIFIENVPAISTSDSIEYGRKSICRIHVYDKNTVVDPTAEALNDVIQTYAFGNFVKGSQEEELEEITESKSAKEEKREKTINMSVTEGLSARDIKNKIKSKLANITLGQSTSTIKSVSVNAQTGGAVGNVLLLQSISDATKGKTGQSQVDFKEDVEVLPGSVSISCLGNPCIQHASQVYVDFNSGTTLDNIYIVKSVSHSIGPGDFSTTLNLSYTGQGTTSAIKNRINEAIDAAISQADGSEAKALKQTANS